MLRVSQLRGALRIHAMLEAARWREANGIRDVYVSPGEREYRSWFPIRPHGVPVLPGQQQEGDRG